MFGCQNVYSLSTLLTQTKVEKLSNEGGSRPLFVRDNRLRGFGLKVTPSGTKTFFVEARSAADQGGKSRRISLGQHPLIPVTEARNRALEALRKIQLGTQPPKQQIGPSLSQLAQIFLEAKATTLRRSTVIDYRMILSGDYFKPWRDRPVKGISRGEIIERYGHLCAEHGVGTANKAMRVLSAALNYGRAISPPLENWPNPVRALADARARRTLKPRTGHLTEDELPLWIGALNEYRAKGPHNVTAERKEDIWLLLHLLLMTGLRSNEARSLLWTDLDLERGTVTIRGEVAKNHSQARLPLNRWLVAHLSNRPRNGSSFVFADKNHSGYIGNLNRPLALLAEATGIRIGLHDLRRSFATYLDRLGTPFGAVKQLLNHASSADITSRYIQKRHINDLRQYSDAVMNLVTQAHLSDQDSGHAFIARLGPGDNVR